jgi:hypothetical protein
MISWRSLLLTFLVYDKLNLRLGGANQSTTNAASKTNQSGRRSGGRVIARQGGTLPDVDHLLSCSVKALLILSYGHH